MVVVSRLLSRKYYKLWVILKFWDWKNLNIITFGIIVIYLLGSEPFKHKAQTQLLKMKSAIFSNHKVWRD